VKFLVIGNGFDLAHGLKTTYRDFLSFCESTLAEKSQKHESFYYYLNKNLWLSHFILRSNDIGSTWIDFEEEILRAIWRLSQLGARGNVNYPRMFIYECNETNTTIRYQRKRTSTQTIFSDKTGNLSSIHECSVEPLEKDKKIWSDRFEEMQRTSKSYCQFNGENNNSEAVANFAYDELRRFVRALEYYLDIVNKTTPLTMYAMREEIRPKSILSFNYTNTFERLYPFSAQNAVYIHGKANTMNIHSNIVLGTRTFTEYDKICKDFNIFAKYHQRQRYDNTSVYQLVLNRLESYTNRRPWIGVVGHSLNSNDKHILHRIFTVNKWAEITVFYHNDDAKINLINEMYALLGEEDAERRVTFVNQHDSLKGLLIPLRTMA
jgi:hypothetical protein